MIMMMMRCCVAVARVLSFHCAHWMIDDFLIMLHAVAKGSHFVSEICSISFLVFADSSHDAI